MLNIINDNIKVLAIVFSIFFAISMAYGQTPTLLSSSKDKNEEEKSLIDIDHSKWKLPQYINSEFKESITKKILPKGTILGKLLSENEEAPTIEILKNNKIVGYVFETFDWVQGLGYSRKPYHIIAGVDLDGKLIGVKLMWHTEPIAILGRTDEDLQNFLNQLQGLSINKGVSIVLGLSDSVLEGEKIAMRGTAGDSSELNPVDGISRTTTTSLLLNDAVMRAARKIARKKNILLAEKDLGVLLNLENFTPKNWDALLADGSITEKIITSGDLVNKFDLMLETKAPRKARLANAEKIWTKIYIAIVNPEGIGANILGRRWYDQYVVSGRNVDDLVVWIGFLGPASFYDKGKNYKESNTYNTIKLTQNNKIYNLKPLMYKYLPFHHAKDAPELIEQGLFYFSREESFNPTAPIKLIYSILGDKKLEYEDNNIVNFEVEYILPEEYVNKDIAIIDDSYDWKNNWLNQIDIIILTIITICTAIFLLVFKDFIVKYKKVHAIVRTGFLLWILLWLGWKVGGQVSIIHLAAIIQGLYDGNGFAAFFAEPVVLLIGSAALISMPIWGRALFCGWLCPFGALQELLNKLAIKIGIKQKFLKSKIDLNMKYVKYFVLLIVATSFLYSFDIGLKASSVEPFKTAITFRFNAPLLALLWVSILLIIGLFIERAYCRFLCPLGAAFVILGKVRLFNFLHRRLECGNPCKACSPTCPTQAIKTNGKIDMNECFQCLDCQVMYFDKNKCPPLVAIHKKAKI